MEEIIVDRILPGSQIIPDGWTAYVNIDEIRNGIYTYSAVIHEQNFVDPEDVSIHINNVENLWMCTKLK